MDFGNKTFHRSDVIDATRVDSDNRTIEISFSSENPVKRYFGWEILGHGPKEVDLSFLASGRAPLLREHWRDEQVGVVESATIDGKKGRAIVRFGNSDIAKQEFADVKDKIRVNVSVGYQIIEAVLVKKDEKNGNTYRVHWKPLEISIVSIPADDTVGTDNRSQKGTTVMTTENLENENNVRPRTLRRQGEQAERNRCREIQALGETHGFTNEARHAIDDGTSIEHFRNFVLDSLERRQQPSGMEPSPEIGLTGREVKRFSFIRLIRSLADPGNHKLREAAGFEFECSAATAQRMHREPKGAYIPHDVIADGRRDLNTSDDSSLVGTTHLASAFIDVLRNKMCVKQAGARILDGLVGNIAIPKKTAGASVYWVAEGINTNPTESEASYGTVSLTPKTVGTFTEITRQMLAQSSPAIEQLTREDLAASVALGIDQAALHGTGTNNQPTGIAATNGIGSVVGGDNGAAPDMTDIVGLESEVAIDNADIGALAYITNPKVRGKLKLTDIGSDTGKMVWDNRVPGKPLNGYPAWVTSQVASNLEKGSSGAVCSAIFFGNWNDLIIGMWGALDILVDPYTYAPSGGLRIRALQDVDVAVRHAESFAAMLDALTT